MKEKIIEKKKLHKIYKSTNLWEDYLAFSELRGLCKKMAQECYSSYVANIEDAIPNNIKKFWNFVNSRRRSVGIPSDMYLDGTRFVTDEEISDAFAKQFGSVFLVDDPGISVEDQFSAGSTQNSDDFVLTADDISSNIKLLDRNKGPGPDEVPTLLLISCQDGISAPLSILFNESLRSGKFPAR